MIKVGGNMKKNIILIIAALLITSCSIKSKMVLKMTAGETQNIKGKVTVPFEYISGHALIVKPKLDGNDYHFIFDTGGMSFVDSSLAGKNGLNDLKKINKDMSLLKVHDSDLNGAHIKDMNFIVMPFADTYKMPNTKIYGMIGSNFLAGFNTTIDYQKGCIELSNPEHLIKKASNPHKLKMTVITPYFPTVKARFNGKSYRAMLDTGLNFPVVLSVSEIARLNEEQKKKLIPSKGLFCKWPFTQKTENYYYYAEEIMIGDMVLRNVPVIFANLPSMIKGNTFLLGKMFLESYKTSLNFKYKEVLLEEISPSINDISYTTGANIVIKNDEFVIAGIWKNSIADRNGLDLTNKIIRLNGKTATELTQKEVADLLYNKTVKDITLELEDNGSIKKLILSKEILKS
jgi:hypothetical protein